VAKVISFRQPAIFQRVLISILCLAPALCGANDRITGAIDNSRRTELPGHVNPRIQSGSDRGPVDASMALPYVTLVLSPSASQQADLEQLLAQQQDPSSPNYHAWLTPEQYADRFGVTQGDIDKIVAWLGRANLTVKSVARGRNAIAVSGTAGDVESAFGTKIHHYLVNGKLHYANAADPSIPVALKGIVTAIRGLHDFRMKPMRQRASNPHYTQDGAHYLGPGDIATIYDIAPLYSAGITGSGEKLVVAGDVEIQLSDIEQYRSQFGLPANDPTPILVPGNSNPGTCNTNNTDCDLDEADLDLELSGSVARNATIYFVYAPDVMTAVQYAIDQNMAPVLSLSYGECELQTPLSEADTFQSWAKQANAQGITWFAASGDAGAADCFGGDDPSTNNSLSVDTPGSVPQVTDVGGTEFAEGSGSYWTTQNGTNETSALRYIPEVAWNDSNAVGSPTATGGGLSVYFTKPSWQTGTGVPNDGARDVPDISLAASPNHDGYYIISGGSSEIIGGTSVGPPQFAGIAVLMNQYLVAHGVQSSPGLGNINPGLYALAPVSGVIHDITAGSNIVTPCSSERDCTATAIGYTAGVGYDLVTGLGTVDVYNLVTSWHNSGVVGKAAVTMSLSASASSVAFSDNTVLTAKVTSANGGTPTGTVTFSVQIAAGTFTLGAATLAKSSSSDATASLTLSATELAAGANTLEAQYSGDTSYNGGSASANITVTTPSTGAPSIKNMTNGASFTTAVAPGGILTIFGNQLAPAVAGTPGTPLPTMLTGTTVTIGGVPAPLYYVSPTQLNVQVPYEVQAGSKVPVQVYNNGESVYVNLTTTATAPAIFTFGNNAPVPFTTAARGQVATLYITGAGAVSPTVATGATPAAGTPVADLPTPKGATILTIGGVAATIDFIGIPTWSVGVVQINYTIPANAPLGEQNVVVSIGGLASAATSLAITQ
jgi:uncharacterized protein (TIGR03437 family)